MCVGSTIQLSDSLMNDIHMNAYYILNVKINKFANRPVILVNVWELIATVYI